jgi:hypothetical protein
MIHTVRNQEASPVVRLPGYAGAVGCGSLIMVRLCLLLVFALAATHAAPPTCFRLRDAALSYTSPSEESTNLTETRIGWFGPMNPDDPLPGALRWTVNRFRDLTAGPAKSPRNGLGL